MIEVRQFSPRVIRQAYDTRSRIYDKTIAAHEHKNHLQAIEQADIQLGEKVLEVAVGPGLTLLELAKRAGDDTRIYGVDLSQKMLQLAKEKMLKEGLDKFALHIADCRKLPFEGDTFDLLYNGYMLDLIPLGEMARVLAEFKRVLKPGGRLILLNKSKKDERKTRLEKLYEFLPAMFVLYIFGLCRPVLMEQAVVQAGFENVSRLYIDAIVSSEIVMGSKPKLVSP